MLNNFWSREKQDFLFFNESEAINIDNDVCLCGCSVFAITLLQLPQVPRLCWPVTAVAVV